MTILLFLILDCYCQTGKQYVLMGIAKEKTHIYKNHKVALLDFTKAIMINPKNDEAYYRRGICKDELNDFEGAIADLDIAINFNSNNEFAFHERGRAKLGLKYFSDAKKDFDTAININPKYENAYWSRAMVNDSLSDYSQAIADYTKVIELDSECAKCFLFRGSEKSKLKDDVGEIADLTQAIDLFKIEIKKNAKDDSYFSSVIFIGMAYGMRGSCKFGLEDYRGAVADFDQDIKFIPNDKGAYQDRGSCKFNLNDKEGACLDWSKAGELGDAEAYDLIKKHCN